MSRKQPQTDDADRDSISLFSRDDRAIEGLPIRLVIAIVVGVAALTVMMTMLDGLDRFDEEELEIEFQDEGVITEGNNADFEVYVVDENGNPVKDATVIVSEGTARIENGGDDRYVTTDSDGEADFSGLDVHLPQGQEQGELEFEIQPPEDSEYTAGDDLESLVVISN